MKPFLVHLHIYYTDMWDELRSKLDVFAGYPYDLRVTLAKENPELVESILEYKPGAKIEIVPNKGFDVAPFVHVINSVNLDDYSYVIKLHSKRNITHYNTRLRGFSMYGTRWKNYLFNFVSSKSVFEKHLNALETNPKLGMLSVYKLILSPKNDSKTIKNSIREFYSKYNLKEIDYKFVAGTMFIAKADIFKHVQKLNLTFDDFEESSAETRDGQLAHHIERFFGIATYLSGYIVADIMKPMILQKVICYISEANDFLYQNHITQSGKRIIKICKIPVYHRTLKHKE